MKLRIIMLAVTGTLVSGVGDFSASAQRASKHCATEECACEEALKRNTVEALEEFLRKYPQSVSGGESACAALAVPSEGEISDPVYEGGDGVTVHPDVDPSEG